MELQHRRAKVSPYVRHVGGDFTNPVQNILGGEPYIVFVNNDDVAWPIVLTGKAGFSMTYTMNPGAIHSWPTAPWITVTANLPTGGTASSFQHFYSPVEVQVSGTPVKIQGNQTPIETEGRLGTVAASTSATILLDGVNTIPIGAVVDFVLALSAVNLTAQLWLQGHSATTPGPSVFGSQVISGSFSKVVPDTLDVWISVGLGSDEPYSFFWQATNP